MRYASRGILPDAIDSIVRPRDLERDSTSRLPPAPNFRGILTLMPEGSHNHVRQIVFSTKHKVELHDYPIPDIDAVDTFTELFQSARDYSMTGKDAMFSLYQSVKYVVENNIAGAIVECGVWRGGSGLLAALTLRKLGVRRPIYLYDTFQGMTAPSTDDVDVEGGRASDYIARYGDEGRWCYASLEEVRATFERYGFGEEVVLIAGDVADTLETDLPREPIAVLRLDTDWYESTKLEMEILYPRLSTGGVLIVDDYGHWRGSRRAVDEYFDGRRRPLLNRVNNQVRLAIKI